MAVDSGKQKKLKGSDVYSRGTSVTQVVIDVTPERMAQIREVAKDTGKSISETVTIIFNAQIEKHEKLKESLRKAIHETMDKEYDRVEANVREIVEPIEEFNKTVVGLIPQLRSKPRKPATN